MCFLYAACPAASTPLASRDSRYLPGASGGCPGRYPESPAAEGRHPAVLPGALTVRAVWLPMEIPEPAGGCRGRPLRLYRTRGRVSVRKKAGKT